VSGWIELLGYATSAAVFAAFCVTEMIVLLCLVILSNLLFMAYGFFEHLAPVLLLHMVLLPVNVVRLVQLQHPKLLDRPGLSLRKEPRR
jgi:hypothetical protein